MVEEKLDLILDELSQLKQRVAKLEAGLPPAPARIAAEKPARHNIKGSEPVRPASGSLELRIGGTLLNRLGVVALLVGLAYFLKYAIDQNWINELARVIMGLAIGGALLAIGRYQSRYPRFSVGLSGAGLGACYISIYAAYSLYGLISPILGFGGAVLVTVAAVLLALNYNSTALAGLGLLAGFMTPVLLGSSGGTHSTLFSYLLVLNAGFLALQALKGWRRLAPINFFGTYILFFVAMNQFNRPGLEWTMTLFLTGFHLVFVLAALTDNWLHRQQDTVPGSGLPLASGVAYIVFATAILYSHDRLGLVLILLAWAGLYLAQMGFVRRLRPQDRGLAMVSIALAVLYLALAVPIWLSQSWITIAWALQALILIGLGHRLGVLRLRIYGFVVLMLAVIRAVFFELSFFLTASWLVRSGYILPWAGRAPAVALVVAVLVIVAWLGWRQSASAGEKRLTPWLVGIANLIIQFALLKELALYFAWMEALRPEAPWQAYLNSAWSASLVSHGFILVVLGIWRRWSWLRQLGIGLLLVAVAKILLIDLVWLETVWRILVFIGTGLLLLVASYLYQRFVAGAAKTKSA